MAGQEYCTVLSLTSKTRAKSTVPQDLVTSLEAGDRSQPRSSEHP